MTENTPFDRIRRMLIALKLSSGHPGWHTPTIAIGYIAHRLDMVETMIERGLVDVTPSDEILTLLEEAMPSKSHKKRKKPSPVKPLEWEAGHADTPIGHYSVGPSVAGGGWWLFSSFSDLKNKKFETIEDAMRAAEDHFDALTRSLLKDAA